MNDLVFSDAQGILLGWVPRCYQTKLIIKLPIFFPFENVYTYCVFSTCEIPMNTSGDNVFPFVT